VLSTLPAPHAVGDDALVDLDGRRFHRITGYDEIPPFFMTIVSASDVWIFISSTGGLTAGRVDAEHALFPYYTDDKVSESAGRTGGLTLLRVGRGGGTGTLWQPFSEVRPQDPPVRRTLYKDVLGTTLVFEEVRPDLALRLRVTWQASARFGVVRTCEVASMSDRPCDVEVLDGLVNLLPAGAGVAAQNELSNLLDAYKRTEIDPETGMGLVYLNSALSDAAEPSESLHANVAWQVGLTDVDHLASVRQLREFQAGGEVRAESEVRGARGAYLVRTDLTLAAGEVRRWRVVADVHQDSADVVALRAQLRDPEGLARQLESDLEDTRERLAAIVAAADAAQCSGDELATTHHVSNVLFNTMRGGLPVDGYTVESDDVRAFVAQRSTRTAQRCADVLDALPHRMRADELVAAAEARDDVDLWRLAMEYLPITFSRRHGDPSRPWNRFRIAVHDDDRSPRVAYEGNWRDIFQNWEALAWSFPEYVESMIAIFLDATTADGYNPYRISRDGIDWEVPEPGNPWSNFGYWSDHQIVYLLKLLETSHRFHPGRLDALVNKPAFTHADVPYRIASYAEVLADPYRTVSFDVDHAAAVAARVVEEGGDGRLVHAADGDLVRVTLAEKLLLLLLAKVVNLVPDGGIWMNTQRPEWNDANNALVGRGLSVVTLAYVRRYLRFLRELLLDADVVVSAELHELLSAVRTVLATHESALTETFDDRRRRQVMDDLGTAGSAYRARVYAGPGGARVTASADDVRGFFDLTQRYVDAALHSNRREDGLVHSYNLMELHEGGVAVRRLGEMLEGQVAVLSSGVLTPEESVALLRGLRVSALYRPDQHTYLLYPDRSLPSFLARNTLRPAQAAACPLVDVLADVREPRVIVRDVEGNFHFAAGIHNARDLGRALDALSGDPSLRAMVERDRDAVLALFEDVFRHAEFTGRSGSFFAYEGLGSVYWHMVSKLLLAVQETLERAVAEGASAEVVEALAAAYEDVRTGLGYCKSVAEYGAFPTDPYSHTPAGSGARQPGMTGQVKEEILTRLGELGLRVEEGRIVVRPLLLRSQEWTTAPGTYEYRDVHGVVRNVDLPAGSLAFTFCQVPVVYRRSDRLAISARLADGSDVRRTDGRLDEALSASIFRRDGAVTALLADVPDLRVPARRRYAGTG
jgi:hypothetical protein